MMHKALKAKTFKSQHEFHKSSHHSVSSAVFGQLRQLHLRQLSLTGFSQQSKELHGFPVLGFSWLRRVWSPLVSEPHAKDIWISRLSLWRFIGCCHPVSEAHSEHIRIGGLSFIIGCLGPLVSESHAKDIWISGLSLWRFIGCCHPVDYRRVRSPLIHSVSEAHSEHIRIGGLSFWRFIGCCPFHPLHHFQSRRQRVIHGSPRNHRHPQCQESRNPQNVLQ